MAYPSYQTTKTSVSVYDDDLDEAKLRAEAKGLSVSVILRDAIKVGLEATKEER